MAVASLTALKALSTTEGATVLTEAGRQGLFIWTEGDYSGPPKGPADDINIVKQDDTALTVGAWVRQQADAISFKLDAIGSTRRPTSTKLGDVVSVYDFGAIGDGEEDDTAAFQAAIDAVNARGGGSVYIPRGDYRISDTLRLYSNIELVGAGSASVIHWIKIYPDSDTRKGFIKGGGVQGAPLERIKLRNFMLMGNATFTGSVPSVVNGQAIFLEWCNKCEITGVEVSGFSDGGIFFFNGNDNLIANCYVRFVSQGLGFLAGNADCRGNVADGNRITDIRHYNGLHAEGGFGGGANSGKLFGTVFVGNTIARCRENGINIELAPGTACIGNTTESTGEAQSPINQALKVFGSPGSSITGNVFVNGWGAAIYIGANSGRCIIGNNSTIGNGVSLRIDDGNGTQTSFDVRLGTNSFTEGAEGKGIVEFAGNVSVAPQVFYASDGVGATLTPQAGLAAHILFTNTAGVPVFYLGQEEGPDGPNLIIYRAGQAQNSLVVRANGDVSIFRRTFADNAAALAGGVGVGGDYKTATSEVRTVVV